MFESVAFFEPYRAILQVLQDFSYETFPMLDYFLGWEKNPSPPGYLKESSEFILTKGEETFTVRNRNASLIFFINIPNYLFLIIFV